MAEGIFFIQSYHACFPGEKLHRLKVSYASGRMSVEELEERSAEAWKEWDEYDAKGLNPDPQGFVDPERNIWFRKGLTSA